MLLASFGFSPNSNVQFIKFKGITMAKSEKSAIPPSQNYSQSTYGYTDRSTYFAQS